MATTTTTSSTTTTAPINPTTTTGSTTITTTPSANGTSTTTTTRAPASTPASPAGSGGSGGGDGKRYVPTWWDILVGFTLVFAPLVMLGLILLSWPEGSTSRNAYEKARLAASMANDKIVELQKIHDGEVKKKTALDAQAGATGEAKEKQSKLVADFEAKLKQAQTLAQAADENRIRILFATDDAQSETPTVLEKRLKPTAHLLLVVALAGAFGALVAGSRNFGFYMGTGRYEPNWRWWYAMRVPTGVGLAVLAFAVARSAFGSWDPVSGTSLDGNIDPLPYVAIGGLAGMFANEAHAKLKEILVAILAKGDEPAKPAGNTPKPTPTPAPTTS